MASGDAFFVESFIWFYSLYLNSFKGEGRGSRDRIKGNREILIVSKHIWTFLLELAKI